MALKVSPGCRMIRPSPLLKALAGQVIGSTDALADSAKDRPVPYQDVVATLYRCLGIDPHDFVRDVFERPVPILPGTTQPVRELL